MYILDKNQKRNMFLMFWVLLISAGCEMLGVSVIFPFIQMLASPEQLMEKSQIKFAADLLDIQSSRDVTLMTGCAIILVYFIKNIILTASAYLQTRYSAGLVKKLSHQLINSYMNRPYQFFVDGSSGEMIRNSTKDSSAIQGIVLNLFKFMSEALAVLCIGAYVISVDPMMAMGVLLICILCFGVIVYTVKKKVSKAGLISREASKKAHQVIIQIFYGIKDIFVRQKRKVFLDKFDKVNEQSCNASAWNTFIGLLPERIIETMCISGIIAVVLIRIMAGFDNETFLPTLAIFAVAAFRILPSISRMTGYVNGFIFQRYALTATYESIKSAREYMASRTKTSRDIEFNEQAVMFENTLEVTDLFWKYNETGDYVLKNLSLSISKGETVGIIGESGSGKSTLCDILLGLYKPQQGDVTVEGYSIFDIPHAWSKIMGYVPQTVFLSDDTIRNNIAFGEENVSDEKVWNALESASLKKYVKTLPNGLDTIVGERGIKFSGGQRQRVAIARALYFNPEILVLDEATSALDGETENAVMESIEALQGKMTLIIVAHRLTTLRSCDKIFEIVEGCALERDKNEILGEI